MSGTFENYIPRKSTLQLYFQKVEMVIVSVQETKNKRTKEQHEVEGDTFQWTYEKWAYIKRNRKHFFFFSFNKLQKEYEEQKIQWQGIKLDLIIKFRDAVDQRGNCIKKN